jgi:hypothetical protein
MARKRPAPKYAGALAQPIYVEDYYKARGLGQPNRELDTDAVKKRAAEKMRLLFEHYKIDPSDEQRWEKLAISLAFEHVPGLQLANRPKPGRKATFKTGLGDQLVRAVEDVKSRTGKRTKEAIAELLKEPEWREYSSQNLKARYWETRARHLCRKSGGRGLCSELISLPCLPRRRRSGVLMLRELVRAQKRCEEIGAAQKLSRWDECHKGTTRVSRNTEHEVPSCTNRLLSSGCP